MDAKHLSEDERAMLANVETFRTHDLDDDIDPTPAYTFGRQCLDDVPTLLTRLAKERARVAELEELLREADGLLVRHHASSVANFDGECPVCATSGSYPANIFGRIEQALAATAGGATGGEVKP